MRSVTLRYPDLASFGRDARREDPELALPADQRAQDGEWVLAVFKVDEGQHATATAARVEERQGGFALVFEPRDWSRVTDELLGPAAVEPAPVSRGRGRSRRPPKKSVAPPPASKRREATTSASDSVAPRSRRPMKSMPPPSTRGTSVLTRTLVPPPAAEIHEADAPDHTLEAPIDPGSFRPASGRKVPRILLVDDDADTQAIVAEMLEAIGMQVEAASDGERALDRLVLQPFDLVVLDWNLPGMDGLELCQEIRKHPRLGSLPVLFLTARSTSRDLVDAFAAGADDFVAKPFRAPELGARLLALLRRAKIGLSSPPPAK